jgi:hypothetical protein
MKVVRYIGPNEEIPKNRNALMDDKGKVQLDFGFLGWAERDRAHPMCYGWHNVIAEDWSEVQ